jgi:hypothetical protein
MRYRHRVLVNKTVQKKRSTAIKLKKIYNNDFVSN